MPFLGTFLKDGDCLTGVIHTPTTQARLTFTPDGSGVLIATIGDQPVGYARPHPRSNGTVCYAVYLHPDILPNARMASLVNKGCVFVLISLR